MSPLASRTDVEARLRRSLNADEDPWIDDILEEASLLVASYCGRDVSDFDPVPDAVRVVTSRVAARGVTTAAPGGEERPIVVGPVQWPAPPPDAVSGGGWLTKADKRMLAPWRLVSRVISVDTA